MGAQQPLDAFGTADGDDDPTIVDADGVFKWVPSGDFCDRCGEETRRLWRDGVRSVCPGCKSW